jgi:hypothetical protein
MYKFFSKFASYMNTKFFHTRPAHTYASIETISKYLPNFTINNDKKINSYASSLNCLVYCGMWQDEKEIIFT